MRSCVRRDPYEKHQYFQREWTVTYPGPAKRDTAAYGGRTRILGASVVSRQHPTHVLLFRVNHTKKIKRVSGIFLWHVFQTENMPQTTLCILFNHPSSSNAGRRRQWNSLKPFSEMLNIQVVPIILTLTPKHSEIIEYANGKNQPLKFI